MIVNFGERETIKLKNTNVDSVNIAVFAKHTTNNTAFAAPLLDAKEVTVKATLFRNKKRHILFNGTLAPLLMAGNFNNAGFDVVLDEATNIVTLATDTSVKEEAIQPIQLKFGGVLNLDGSDELHIELNSTTSAAGTGVDTSTSYIDFNYNEAIGYEIGIPYLDAHSVSNNKERVQLSLGSGVSYVHFINFDKTTNLAADEVIRTLNMSSDRLNIFDDKKELDVKRLSQFQSLTLSNARNNCYQLHGGEGAADNVDLDLLLNSANVVSSNNYVVVQRMDILAENIEKVSRTMQKHQVREEESIMARS